MTTLTRQFRTLALKLQEAPTDLSHNDICKTLSDCLSDLYPGKYCYVADVYGDADSGDVVYCCGNEYLRAPYEIQATNGKRTHSIDTDQAENVLPRTVYDSESDDDDNYAGMEERFPGAVEALLPIAERFISKDERDSADSGDFAGSGRSFPILKPGDVMAAVRSIGRGVAGGQSATSLKNKIKAIAKRKGWGSKLPKAWQDEDKDKEGQRWKPDGVLLVEGARFLDEPRLQEAATADYPIKLIAPGRGSSGYYTEGVLKNAAENKIFRAGTQMFWNHDTDAEESARPEGDLNRLAAVTTTDAVWDEAGRDGAGLYARAKVFSDYAGKVKEKGPHIGLSIRAGGSRDESANGPDGKPRVITALRNAMSVDFVTKAGRDGKIFTESAGVAEPIHTQETNMDEAQIKALIKEAVTPLETRLTEAQTENKALRAKLAEAEAPARIRETLATIRMPDYGKAEVIRRMVTRGLPDDPKDLAAAVEAEARSVAELLQDAGVGSDVVAFGARMTEAEIEKQQKGSEKQHEKQWKESIGGLCDLFVGPKLAEGEADPVLVAKRKAARKAFKEGRAA